MDKTEKQLRLGLEDLNIQFNEQHVEQLMFLLNQLILWSKKINLTAITKPSEVVTKHLLDSVAMLPLVQAYVEQSDQEGLTILDVGTGAGFPTLPLSIFTSDIRYYPLDSNSKKLAFIRRVANQLKLSNVETIHSRLQDLQPAKPYSIVTARAFADVNDLLTWLPGDCTDDKTEVLAMKGKVPEEELATLKDSLLSSQWELLEIIDLDVPGLDAERCVLRLKRK